MNTSSDLWVFGYGSLMWKPGFAFDDMRTAILDGWHRELCIYSRHWRGTEEQPGLVLGLDAGGSCKGLAFRVGAERAEQIRAYLHEREMRGSVYREIMHPVRLETGETVEALTYVSDSTHPQYAGNLTREQRLAIIAESAGEGGLNRDYVINTVLHLRQLYVREEELEWLHVRLGGEAFNDAMAGI
jgi:cation transport protein ChaC